IEEQRLEAGRQNQELLGLATPLDDTNRALQTARDAALAADRVKTVVLANMSHEIPTPMNGGLRCLDLLLETPPDSPPKQYAHTARSSAEALLTVINDILDLAQIEAGKLRVTPTDFNIYTVVHETFALVAGLGSRKSLEMRCTVQPDLPGTLVGDPARLRQVL